MMSFSTEEMTRGDNEELQSCASDESCQSDCLHEVLSMSPSTGDVDGDKRIATLMPESEGDTCAASRPSSVGVRLMN